MKKPEQRDSILHHWILFIRYSIFVFYSHRIDRTYPGPSPEVKGNMDIGM